MPFYLVRQIGKGFTKFWIIEKQFEQGWSDGT